MYFGQLPVKTTRI